MREMDSVYKSKQLRPSNRFLYKHSRRLGSGPNGAGWPRPLFFFGKPKSLGLRSIQKKCHGLIRVIPARLEMPLFCSFMTEI